jgi:hypothetical protein
MDMSRIEWRKASYSNSNGGNCVEVGMSPAEWRKASHSSSNGGNCVEVGMWRKATYSNMNGGACVEVGEAGPVIAVRDSKDPDGPKLVFGQTEWQTFAARIKTGEFTA